MTGKADATAFLDAEQHVALEHLFANMLEAHAGLGERQVMAVADHIHHRGGGQGLNHPPLPFTVLEKMMEQQADNLVGGEGVAPAVHAADPVGITVGGEAKVGGLFLQCRPAASVVALDGLGVETAEVGIVFAVEGPDPAVGAFQQFFKAARPYPEQRLVGKVQPGLGDEFEVDHALEGLKIIWEEILNAQQFSPARVLH